MERVAGEKTRLLFWKHNIIDCEIVCWLPTYVNEYFFVLVYNTGSGELFDDIVRDGAYDIFWCYGFERDVAKYKRIPTNNKSYEISYTSYLKQCLTNTYHIIQNDLDGLVSDNRKLREIHKYLRLSSHLYRTSMENMVVCDDWRRNCVVVVRSQQLGRELSCVLLYIRMCQYLEMIKMKGIVVRRRKRALQMQALTRTYMLNYWR